MSEKPPTDGNEVIEPPKPKLTLVGSDSPRSTLRARAQLGSSLVRHDHDIHLTTKEAVSYLVKHPNVYQRDEKLVEVVNGRIRDLTPAILRKHLVSQMTFMGQRSDAKTDRAKMVPRVPSDAILHSVHQDGEWNARPLRGVTDTPLVRRDGTILQTSGYDEASQYVYKPSVEYPPIDPSPSRDQCLDVMSKILAPISDFPWRKDENGKMPSLSAYVSLLLTLLLVPAIDGPIPGFAISANIRGTGKGKLASIASVIALGVPAETESFPDSDDEIRKRLTGSMKAGDRLIVFDNVTRKISGDTIDMTLTSRIYKDRELATNRNLKLPNNSVFVWTGNNLEAAGDTVRRILPIEIVYTDFTPPEERTFDTDPVADALKNRADIVVALLTMIRGWYVAGSPDSGQRLGSFEGWSSIVPQILVWLGLSSPLDARRNSNITVDSTLRNAIVLADAWKAVEVVLGTDNGITTATFLRVLYPEKGEPVFMEATAIRDEVETVLGTSGRREIAAKLQYQLRSVRDRVLDDRGRKFRQAGVSAGAARWTAR